jgi:hypothetical protein
MSSKMDADREKEKTGAERRRFPRIETRGFCLLGGSEEKFQIINIGPGGLRISSPMEFEEGNRYRLKIFLELGHRFETQAYVVWSHRIVGSPFGDFEVGFKFVDLPVQEFHRLRNLVDG